MSLDVSIHVAASLYLLTNPWLRFNSKKFSQQGKLQDTDGMRNGSIACENLNKDSCAFAVSSSGKRCVLEKGVRRSGEEVFVCSTSQIDTDKLTNWIETDECLEACGLNRNVLGISSDSLLESKFTQKLCTTQCYNGCPNIVDLYFNLAAGEGVYLPSLCQTQGDNKRRGMSEIRSSGFVAPGPVVPVKLMTDGSPIMAPSPA